MIMKQSGVDHLGSMSATFEDARKNLGLHSGILILTFLLLPMYIFSSGSPQPVDILIFINLLWVLIYRYKINKDINKDIFTFSYIVIWSFIVNIMYYVIYQDLWNILSSLALLNGLLIIYTFSVIFYQFIKDKKITFLYILLFVSILGCFLVKGYTAEFRGDAVRPALSFNNPNQLAYFAIILLGYIILIENLPEDYKKNKFHILFNIIIIIIAHYLLLLSLSRAGIVAAILLDVCILKNIFSKKGFSIFTLILLFFLIIIAWLSTDFILERYSKRAGQFEIKESKFDMLTRALKPIKAMNGLELLFGKGTGMKASQSDQDSKSPIAHRTAPMEVHNSFGDIFRSYGMIGLLLFSYWFFRLVWKSRRLPNGIMIMMALTLFNFAHMGLRFRSFYIFIAFLNISIYFSHQNNKEKLQIDEKSCLKK
jgi:O-antigen ligase